MRPNVRRLASLSGGHSKPARLNLSTAVVDAGEEAWIEIAPALEGDRGSLARLRQLTRAGIVENRRRRRGGRRGGQRGSGAPRPLPSRTLPPPRCQGTRAQQIYLDTLVSYLRDTTGVSHLFPDELQLRISKRMTSALGLHSHRGSVGRITIAERLFRPGLEAILWETVKHELAHAVDLATNAKGRSSHGPRWKAWAMRLGARPTRLCSREESECVRRAPDRADGAVLEYPAEVMYRLTSRAGEGAGLPNEHPNRPSGDST